MRTEHGDEREVNSRCKGGQDDENREVCKIDVQRI